MTDINIYKTSNQYGEFYLLENDLISTHINMYGEWEPHLFYFYSQFIKPDFTIIDGGANIGYHTVQFAKLANKGTVYSFEPQPLIFSILNLNIFVNQLYLRVKSIPLGLADNNRLLKMSSIKEQIFSQDIINYGGRRLVEAGNGEAVHTISLDTFFGDNYDNLKVDLIKLDIQGYELEAILGAKNLLSNNHPIFFIENYTIEPYVNKDRQVLSTLMSYGYVIYRIKAMNNEDCIILHPDFHNEEIKFITTQHKYEILVNKND
jgi:FkbM family methyltransferase